MSGQRTHLSGSSARRWNKVSYSLNYATRKDYFEKEIKNMKTPGYCSNWVKVTVISYFFGNFPGNWLHFFKCSSGSNQLLLELSNWSYFFEIINYFLNYFWIKFVFKTTFLGKTYEIISQYSLNHWYLVEMCYLWCLSHILQHFFFTFHRTLY